MSGTEPPHTSVLGIVRYEGGSVPPQKPRTVRPSASTGPRGPVTGGGGGGDDSLSDYSHKSEKGPPGGGRGPPRGGGGPPYRCDCNGNRNGDSNGDDDGDEGDHHSVSSYQGPPGPQGLQ